MTILLTAANGKTGRAVLKALANRGADVKVFLRDEAQWPALNELGASSFAVGDMEDAATIDAAMESCDGIIHIGPPMHPERGRDHAPLHRRREVPRAFRASSITRSCIRSGARCGITGSNSMPRKS